MLKCGFAKENITPKMGMAIPGYFEPRIIDGVLDELYAKALCLEADNTVIIITCDTINLNPEDTDAIRAGISEKTGVLNENIIVHASHTHTGGPTWQGFEVVRDAEYIEMLISQAIKAGISAYNSKVPALFGAKTGKAEGITFIRRFFFPDGKVVTNPKPDDPNKGKPEGVPDETYTLFKICDTAGKPIVFWSSFGLHLDTVSGNKVCADYPAALARKVYDKYGCESIFMTGPCGNLNHFDHSNLNTYTDPDIREKIADVLFNELVRLEGEIELKSDVKIKAYARKFKVNLRKPTDAAVSYAKGILSGEIKEEGSKMRSPHLFSRMLIDVHNNPATETTLEVNRISIGDANLVAWPGEIFCDFGMELRENKGENVMIAELCNGTVRCYIPTVEGHKNGGYEPDLVDPWSVEEEAGDKILAETLKMW